MTKVREPARITVIAPHFKRRLSGVTSTVVQLVPRQVKSGVQIATLGPGLPADLPALRWRDLVHFWRLPPDGLPRVWHARRNVEMATGIVLRDVLRMPMRLLFTSAAQRHHKPLTRFMIGRMDGVVATSERSAAYLHVPHRVVRHGIDLERFSADAARSVGSETAGLAPFEGRKLVGCFGRIRPSKGTDLFVDAMIELLPRHPDWTAVIGGRRTAEFEAFGRELDERIARAGLSDRIVFLGEVADIRPWYERIDLYVAPSRNEGFGLTPLEAMAFGKPVVASDAGAYAELIEDGATGRVVPASDGAALRDAIEPYLGDDERRTSHGAAAHRRVSSAFDLDYEVRTLSSVYGGLRWWRAEP